MIRRTLRNADISIRYQEPFNCNGTLTGHDHVPSVGILPAHERNNLYADEPSYVVLSYATPIAWFGKRGWYVPDVRYSVTTSRHQGIARMAIR